MGEFEDFATSEFQRDSAQYYIARALFATLGDFVGYEALFDAGNNYWGLKRVYDFVEDRARILDVARELRDKFLDCGKRTGVWYRLERDVQLGLRLVQTPPKKKDRWRGRRDRRR